jgi:hypothetical protein
MHKKLAKKGVHVIDLDGATFLSQNLEYSWYLIGNFIQNVLR